MVANAITGEDTLVLRLNTGTSFEEQVISDLADEDNSVIDLPNDIASLSTGKNGNGLWAKNEQGRNADLSLRLVKASLNDRFLSNGLNAQLRDFVRTGLITGSFIKKIGDENGNVLEERYNLSGGKFMKIPNTKSNSSGDTDQSTSPYMIKFNNVTRVFA